MKYLILSLTLLPMFALANAPQKRDFRPLKPKRIIKKEETNKLPKWDKEEKVKAPDSSLFPRVKFDW